MSEISVDYGIVSCFTAGCWVRGIDSTTHNTQHTHNEVVLLFSSILIPHFQPLCTSLQTSRARDISTTQV